MVIRVSGGHGVQNEDDGIPPQGHLYNTANTYQKPSGKMETKASFPGTHINKLKEYDNSSILRWTGTETYNSMENCLHIYIYVDDNEILILPFHMLFYSGVHISNRHTYLHR